MPKHTPQIPLATSREYAWQAHVNGTDAAEFHGDCTSPIDRALRGVGSPLLAALAQWKVDEDIDYADGYGLIGEFAPPNTRTVFVRVRCRKCEACLGYKRRLWTARAIYEVRQSMRTWFGTLTVGPERRLWAQMVADKRAVMARGESLSSLSSVERTRALAAVLAPEVTRWLKRVRKAARSDKLRYLLVTEAHSDGFPHFHLLLHERGQPVSKRTLEAKWLYGFSNWRLVPAGEIRQVGYVCKYIAKSAQTRVRASRHYGQSPIEYGQ
ncbi:hypothetical protein NT2_13_00600 [Caenibius tardaugens NBRC 16725]|uniref:Replication-associated protein ORF2/G2P domain-containing protein n=1 Tax=Caenibius tardaugens NBRC 16725 TaxID=1219035 RepID=U3A889_9SPHN|nr:hypothetical protein [Caenibius tardaugens]AZI37897.1 hypothetical protein EGO55_19615 [Caenibius tardaugens NBRC 16725]GAD50973.1 hypothetical protein NT2_13_00600 [Caenibius tardaugens NBRC 16725]